MCLVPCAGVGEWLAQLDGPLSPSLVCPEGRAAPSPEHLYICKYLYIQGSWTGCVLHPEGLLGLLGWWAQPPRALHRVPSLAGSSITRVGSSREQPPAHILSSLPCCHRGLPHCPPQGARAGGCKSWGHQGRGTHFLFALAGGDQHP